MFYHTNIRLSDAVCVWLDETSNYTATVKLYSISSTGFNPPPPMISLQISLWTTSTRASIQFYWDAMRFTSTRHYKRDADTLCRSRPLQCTSISTTDVFTVQHTVRHANSNVHSKANGYIPVTRLVHYKIW